jgi:pyrroloquinoline quinone biosynthesis protein E
MNGWASMFLTITPNGTALPCHSAGDLPINFPNVKHNNVADIWTKSAGFNQYRGDDWMQEPCRSCPEKKQDFGGCRCQAFMLTGDATNADPVCEKSPHHAIVEEAVKKANCRITTAAPFLFRNMANSKRLIAKG